MKCISMTNYTSCFISGDNSQAACTKYSGSPMVGIVKEDVVIGAALEHLAAPTSKTSLICEEDCIQVLRGCRIAGVILQK